MILREHLMSANVTGRGYDFRNLSLMELVTLTGEKSTSTDKEELITQLESFLTNPNQVVKVWREFTDFERACISDYIVNNGYMFEEGVERLAKVYKIQKHESNRSYLEPKGELNNYFKEDTKIGLFFIKGYIPAEMINILEGELEAPVFDIRDAYAEASSLDNLYVFKGEGSLQRDLVKFVKYCGSGNMKATVISGYPTRRSMEELNSMFVSKEYETECISLETMYKIEETYKLFGLYQLVISAGIIEKQGKNGFKLGEEGKEFLKLPITAQVKMLFEAYQKTTQINEVERIKGEKLFTRIKEGLPGARLEILHILSNMPHGVWLNMNVIRRETFKCKRYFFYQHIQKLNYPMYRYGYNSLEHSGWNTVEHAYIDVMLLEYLAPLGMVDVAVEEVEILNGDTGKSKKRLQVSYFQVTELGAYLLGMKEEYEDPTLKDKVDNDLWINEHQQVIVGESKKANQHHVFFEAFCEKEESEEGACYSLDFTSILKALHEGMKVEDIWKYLKMHATKPLPSYIRKVFNKWKVDQRKIRIRTVTLLECEDDVILEELQETIGIKKHTKGMLYNVLELKPGTAQKVQKEVEKQCYFCRVEGITKGTL